MDNKRDQQSLSRTYKIKGDSGQIVAFRGRGRGRRWKGEMKGKEEWEGEMKGKRGGKGKEEGERERERESDKKKRKGGGRREEGRSVGQPTLGESTSLHLS